jgi:hypothetical protein
MDIILEDTKKYIRDVASTRVENVIHYIYIYISNQGWLGSIGRILERPPIVF